MTQLATFLINLDGSTERLKKATAILAKIGLDFKRVAAFDGRGLPAESLPQYAPQRARTDFGRALSGGEIGCYLSQLRCVELLLATDARYGLVLEDDLGITPDTAAAFPQLLSWLDRNQGDGWDVVNLGKPALRYFVPVEDYARPNPLCHAFQ